VKAHDQPIGDDDLQALIDGRLSPERKAMVEAYLATQPALAADVAADMDISAQLRARLAAKAEEPIPSRLRVAHLLAERRRAGLRPWRAIAASIALVAAGAAIGWSANSYLQPRAPRIEASASRDAFAAYRTFVVEKLHPVEVRADDEAHLVQWLSRRLGKPLSAPDLSAQGYQLMGGRLLPTEGGGPAAMFMYADQSGHRLTLYARNDPSDRLPGFRFEQQGGVSAFSWIDRDLAYVVTAKVERPVLQGVAEAVYRQLNAEPPGKSL
jgi:anti-sigma factor RsiW